MPYIVLARKWRPKTFEEVIGQEHITTTLKNAIKAGRVAHAYLFCGPRGIGKTTTARLMAKALNCVKGPTALPCNKCSACREISRGENLDVLEIDGASNRGINEIRSLRENVKFSPASSKYKIYIIDEIHMLTTEAFNALLKTLEEPPLHIKFIFATTQPFKVPSTILSRCQRFDFRPISIGEIVSHLGAVARAEKIDIADGALLAIARGAEGSMRDAQSILDQLISFTPLEKKSHKNGAASQKAAGDKKSFKIGESDVYALLGTVKEAIFEDLTLAIASRNTIEGIRIINELVNEGKDLGFFLTSSLEHFRNLVVLKLGKDSNQLIDLPPENIQRIEQLAEQFTLEELLEIIYLLAEAEGQLKGAYSAKLTLEMAVIRLTELPKGTSFKEILRRLADLEKRLEGPEPIVHSPQPIAQSPQPTAQSPQPIAQSPKPTAPSVKNDLSRIKNIWPEVIQQVRQRKITTAAFLSESTPSGLNGKNLTLSFKRSCNFHKESIEAEGNRHLLEEVLKEKLGEEFIVNCVLSQAETVDSAQEADVNKGKESSPGSKKKSDDPLIEKVLHFFKGEIVEGE